MNTSKELAEAIERACAVLDTLYFEYQRKIGPYASQAHDAAMKLSAASRANTPETPVSRNSEHPVTGLEVRSVNDPPPLNATNTSMSKEIQELISAARTLCDQVANEVPGAHSWPAVIYLRAAARNAERVGA